MKQIFMKSFSHYINEVVITDKPHVVPEYLKGTKHKYHSGEDFAKGSTHIGNIGGLEIHSKENPGGGMTHFTRDPKTGLLHHVLTNVETSTAENGRKRLKFLTMHKREGSPVSGHALYHHLVTNHNVDLVATSHSKGAAKSWNKLAKYHGISIHGEHSDGSKSAIHPDDVGTEKTHAPSYSKSPVRKMHLIATVSH